MQNQSSFMTILVLVVIAAAGYAFFKKEPPATTNLNGIENVEEFETEITAPASTDSNQDSGESPNEPVPANANLVLVKFGATWCPPCRAIDSELAQLKKTHESAVKVVKVDVDEHPDLAEEYNVSSIPRLLLFHDGEVVDDRTGFYSHKDLVKWVSAFKRTTSNRNAPPRGMVQSNPFIGE